jgi:hypothetical protein
MLGDSVAVGLVTMALLDVFAEVQRRSETRFRMMATLVEIYNETVVDLFAAAAGRLPPARGYSITVRALPACFTQRVLIEKCCCVVTFDRAAESVASTLNVCSYLSCATQR